MTWEYTEELGDKICEKMIEGLALTAIERLEGMPSEATIYRWAVNNDDFASKYTRARRAQGEASIEKQKEIIDNCMNGSLPADVARVAIAGMQWRAAKLEPKKYGDKMVHQGDAENPVVNKMIVEYVG